MLHELLQALVDSKNEAADDLLLEGLRLGTEQEKTIALGALLRRKAVRGLSGVIEQYDSLPESLQHGVLANVGIFHFALRECGRSDRTELRLAAMKLIALSHQGLLAYVLSENLHDLDEILSKAATEAMVAMARWVAMETRALQKSAAFKPPGTEHADDSKNILTDSQAITHEPAERYQRLMENRPEIEAAVARAMDVHRGKHGPDLLRAALLLCDWPGSKTLAILQTMKHAGQSPMVRRLQQPPAAEHVDAFLLGASHGQLRSHFGIAFSHIEEAPVLDALLRKTHWLKDHQLQLCVHQVTRGAWWDEAALMHDIDRRPASDAVKIAEWLATSGMHDSLQDQRMDALRMHASEDFTARLHLLRIAAQRKRGTSIDLLKAFLTDPDERLLRMAAREIVRRRPPDFENILLQIMTTAPESVRKVISRSIGQAGFEQFWQRFDRMERMTRKQAGKAMLKLLPDAMTRLSRRLSAGPIEQRVKALQIVQELGLAEPLRHSLIPLCSHPHARVRSKAVSVVGEVPAIATNVILDKVLNDTDARVRANAIEVLEAKQAEEYVPLLAQRARSTHNRERANAIKAMGRMKVATASNQLLGMLRDQRPDHRISAMWALRQIGWWNLLTEVGRIAKQDPDPRAKRYAVVVLRAIAELAAAQKKSATIVPPTKLAG
ncbi:MAG TPA: HEAT repeat domain-containing protein [Tepidisphaeraceae bacterium]|jgi:HEAT repeat protein|nr:HEAT repeat domain-containing protein [Tepidisphaeraceae bacterium]